MLAAAWPDTSNAFAPHSPGVSAIYSLQIEALVVFCLIYAIVGGGIVYAIVRFRTREGEPDPKQVHGNKRVELTWTAIPLLIVTLLFILTLRTMATVDPAPPAKPDLIVTGHQFWWEARYADSGVIVANEIHIPVGRRFALEIDSSDVLHEFWVVELTRKIIAIPGQKTHIWMEADRPNTYVGVCTEFCGTQHAWMRFNVVAEEQAKYLAWKAAQLRPAPVPETGPAAQGLALFQSLTCRNCHAIQGVPGVDGRVAPDLTHLGSRQYLAGGVVENTPENLRRWLVNPQDVKPGALMPNYNFTHEQLDQLTAYFATLR